MDEKLRNKIAMLITEKAEFGETSWDCADKIIAMIEAEKPDTIPLPKAVEALVEYFGDFNVCVIDAGGAWRVYIDKWMDAPFPDWAAAIDNGWHSKKAVRVGLEDLFTTILTDAVDKEAEHE